MTSLRDNPVSRLEEPSSNVAEVADLPTNPLHLTEAADGPSNGDLQARGQALGIDILDDVKALHASATFIKRIPIGYARRHALLGVAGDVDDEPDNEHIQIAVADLTTSVWQCLDVLSRLFNKPIKPVLAPRQDILAAINQAYQQQTGQADAMIEKLDKQQVLEEIQQVSGREDLLDVASRAPVIKLVNLILFEAVKMFASDVHIQPYETNLVVRVRIDGVLFDAFTLPQALHEEIVSRIKVMGKMNIAEKRLAQDGRATVQVGDRVIDLRISAVPASHGERVVIRLLDKSARLYTLGELGMDQQALETFGQLIHVEHGLMLVTGPTGSGKSTTLYAALHELRSKELNILTLEDPIEYQLEGISQIQVSDKKGMNFASGLRSVLRQDPDIIMVGEIRDRETAVLAIQSALTGHLVFSTLHTNDAASAVTRLLDLGIEPYLVASSVVGVLAQRLVRRICDQCAAPVNDATTQLDRLNVDTTNIDTTAMQRGNGCEHCRQTGYRGRIGIFEMLVVDEAIRHHIQAKGTAADVKQAAIESGMQPLRQSGVYKILEGLTTVDEVVRVTMRSSK